MPENDNIKECAVIAAGLAFLAIIAVRSTALVGLDDLMPSNLCGQLAGTSMRAGLVAALIAVIAFIIVPSRDR